MLLLIDIGNTNITIGVSKDAQLIGNWRVSTNKFATSDELWMLLCSLLETHKLNIDKVHGAAMGSVVPRLTSMVEQLLKEKLGAPVINVSSNLDLGIEIECEYPDSVGADRLCNTVAGYQKYGGPLVIVDFGTATTFDVVSENGHYLGGIIAAGPETTISILHAAAAKLPAVELQFPPNLIGTTTETSIQSGIMFGIVAMIDGLNRRLIYELGRSTKIIATGGLSAIFVASLETVELLEPNLTLDGLQSIFDRCAGRLT